MILIFKLTLLQYYTILKYIVLYIYTKCYRKFFSYFIKNVRFTLFRNSLFVTLYSDSRALLSCFKFFLEISFRCSMWSTLCDSVSISCTISKRRPLSFSFIFGKKRSHKELNLTTVLTSDFCNFWNIFGDCADAHLVCLSSSTNILTKILISNSRKLSEALEIIRQAFGDDALSLSRAQSFEWHVRFKKSWTLIEDDKHRINATPENVTNIICH